ncbi:MAG: antibiotic biosynthesis monooxygenase [Pseudomonas sp.]
MNDAIVSLASFQACTGRSEELGLRLCELLLRARLDATCLGCELIHDAQQPQRWQLRGQWCSEQALQSHLQLPHMQLLGGLVAGGLVQQMEMQVEPARAG